MDKMTHGTCQGCSRCDCLYQGHCYKCIAKRHGNAYEALSHAIEWTGKLYDAIDKQAPVAVPDAFYRAFESKAER